MAGKVKAKELKGNSIYQDEKNRTIYSDFFTKDKGYVITNYDADAFYLYSLRFTGAVIVTVTLIMFLKSPWIGYGGGILFYLVTSIMFYFLYLRNLTVIKFKKPKRDNYIVKLSKVQTQKGMIASIIGGFVIGAIIIIHAIGKGYEDTMLVANYIIGGIALVFAICNILALIYSKKNKK